jgi:uncharacterized protein YeaC (DUF1315 family)
VRTLHDWFKIIEEIEKNLGEKRVDIAKWRYAHSVTDADREHSLGLEKSYFQLRQNSAKKQKTMYDFFC